MILMSRLSVVVLVLCAAPVFASEPGTVTIHRDNWGVPYIFAETDADAAFGLGYAQAEDRLDDLYINIRTAIGRMSEVFGPSFIDQDYAMRMVKNEQYSRQLYENLPANLREYSDAFIRGVEAYIEKHPDAKSEFALDLHPAQLVAIGRAMILRWPLGQIQDELRNTRNSNGFGSNQWSVAPSRSADGSAILLTDPHLTWEGMAVFYEAHVFADTLEMHGFFLVGSPLLALGHNGNVGWAATTGGPDTADVFQLKLNPDNPLQYEYDGEMRTARIEFITIPVKDQEPVRRPAGFTHLGPLFSEPDYEKGIALVGASPYFESEKLFEMFFRMSQADSTDELYEAMSLNEYMEQNIMFADRNGNIRYVRAGRVPKRPEGYDWTKAVPGHSSATAWAGIHSIDDLVQIENPEQGYMQNCNISPVNMMIGSTMTPDKYPDYIYNVSWDRNNTRGMRATELLHADDDVTVEEAKAFAMDVHDILGEAWQKAIEDAAANAGNRSEDFEAAVETLLAWDRQWTKESKAGPLMWYLRQDVHNKIDIEELVQKSALTTEDLEKIADGIENAVAKLEELHGTVDVTWGDIHKVGRSGKYFPVGGMVHGSGPHRTRTLFNVAAREIEPGSGVHIARSGSMSMVLMIFRKDGVEAWTCIQWGQSADPASPHHLDQAEKLYTQRKFKRAWTTFEELQPHIASTLELSTT